VKLLISSDAHSTEELRMLRWGVTVARRAWLTADDVLNTRSVEAFRAGLRRSRGKARPSPQPAPRKSKEGARSGRPA
jgi:hypothetical protein